VTIMLIRLLIASSSVDDDLATFGCWRGRLTLKTANAVKNQAEKADTKASKVAANAEAKAMCELKSSILTI
jgi:hypothetical protein